MGSEQHAIVQSAGSTDRSSLLVLAAAVSTLACSGSLAGVQDRALVKTGHFQMYQYLSAEN